MRCSRGRGLLVRDTSLDKQVAASSWEYDDCQKKHTKNMSKVARYARARRRKGQGTHAASLQQQLTLAEAVGAVGELHQGLLRLVSHGGVSSLVQLLTQDLQLGKALENTDVLQMST